LRTAIASVFSLTSSRADDEENWLLFMHLYLVKSLYDATEHCTVYLYSGIWNRAIQLLLIMFFFAFGCVTAIREFECSIVLLSSWLSVPGGIILLNCMQQPEITRNYMAASRHKQSNRPTRTVKIDV